MGINPINPNLPPQAAGTTLSKQELINKMQHLEEEFRVEVGKYAKDPHSATTIRDVCQCLYKLRDFLEKNKNAFFADAKAQGWHKYNTMDNDGYEGIYHACMVGINAFLNPSTRPALNNKHTSGSPDFVNEQFTQLTWMLQNKPHHHRG